MNNSEKLQKEINYNFNNIKLLETALTHKSVSGKTSKNNQRLEFLGDSILGAVISTYLYNKFPSYSDGDLTKLKSLLVKKETLAELGKILSLSEYLVKSDKTTRITISMLEDTVEAIIGAVYLDSNFDLTQRIIVSLFEKHFMKKIISRDFLTQNQSFTARLKEFSEKKYQTPPEVKMIKKEGKDNAPTFIMEVKVGNIIQQGKGSSKKDAISNASKKILNIIQNL